MGNALKVLVKSTLKHLAVAYGGHKVGDYLEGSEKQEIIVRPEINLPTPPVHSEISASLIVIVLLIFLFTAVTTLLVVNACIKCCKKCNRGGEIIPMRTYNTYPVAQPRAKPTEDVEN